MQINQNCLKYNVSYEVMMTETIRLARQYIKNYGFAEEGHEYAWLNEGCEYMSSGLITFLRTRYQLTSTQIEDNIIQDEVGVIQLNSRYEIHTQAASDDKWVNSAEPIELDPLNVALFTQILLGMAKIDQLVLEIANA